MTVKHCNRPAVGAHRLGQVKFIDVLSFILARIMLGLQKQTLGEVETKTLI